MQSISHAPSGDTPVHHDEIVGTHDTNGQTYWVDLRTNQTAWSREELSHAPLPDGIITNYDANSGCLYYIHLATGRTGWTLAELWRHNGSIRQTNDSRTFDASEVCPSPRPSTTQLIDGVPPPPHTGPHIEQDQEDGTGHIVDELPFHDGPPIEQYYQDVVGTDGKRCSLRCQGTLLKRGHGSSFLGRRNWQQRWFAIDLATSRLTYYTDDKMTICKGCLRLGESSQVEPGNAKKSKGRMNLESPANTYYFVLTSLFDVQTNRQRSGSLELCARTEQEMHEWIQSLSHCISRLSKALQPPGQPIMSDHSSVSVVDDAAYEIVGKQLPESQDVQPSVARSYQRDPRGLHPPSLEHSGDKKLAQQSTSQTSFDASRSGKYQTMLDDGHQTAPVEGKMRGNGLGMAMLEAVIPVPPPRRFEHQTHSDSMQLAPGKGPVIPAAVNTNNGAVGASTPYERPQLTSAPREPVKSAPSPEIRPTLHKDLREMMPSSQAGESESVDPPPAVPAPPLGGDTNLLAQIRARTSAATANVFATYITASCAGWC